MIRRTSEQLWPSAWPSVRGARRDFACLCAMFLAACGGSTFDGRVYHGEGFAFRIGAVPATWQKLEMSNAALAFEDSGTGATVALNARCGMDGDDVPLVALTNHLFLSFTERQPLSEEIVPFDGREALHTVMVAKLDGVPKKFDTWVLKKDGCVFDLLYIVRPERYDAGIPEFHRFVQAFATVSPDDD